MPSSNVSILMQCVLVTIISFLWGWILSMWSSWRTCGRVRVGATALTGLRYGPILAVSAVLLVAYVPYLTQLMTQVLSSTSSYQSADANRYCLILFLCLHFAILTLFIAYKSEELCILSPKDIHAEVDLLMKQYNRETMA
jgi:Flp pilus assembly pilin Flp